jgi:hypothetical protein
MRHARLADTIYQFTDMYVQSATAQYVFEARERCTASGLLFTQQTSVQQAGSRASCCNSQHFCGN